MREAYDIPFRGWTILNAFVWVGGGVTLWALTPMIIGWCLSN